MMLECSAAVLFGALCLAADTVSGAFDCDGKELCSPTSAWAGLLYGFVQHKRLQHLYNSLSTSQERPLRVVTRHFLTRLYIPTVMLIVGVGLPQIGSARPLEGSGYGLACAVLVEWFSIVGHRASSGRIRGTEVISFTEARQNARALAQFNEQTVAWGSLTIPERLSEGHFALVGTTGSGKSISMRYLLQSVLPSLSQRPDARALIFDAKRDMLPILGGMKLAQPVIVLNPFDARSYAWDIAADITDLGSTLDMAAILLPTPPNDSHPFFSKAAQTIVSNVLKAFIITRPGQWTLRDLLNATSDDASVRAVLRTTPETEKLVAQFSEPESVFRNIMQTVATGTATLEPIAALWSRADRKLSLRDWLSSNSILLLGHDWTYSEAMRSVNRLIFKRLTQLVLNETESFDRRTWFFIDELKEAGNLDGLTSLLSFGRSKGVRVALAFQDLDGLRHVFEERPANEIVGLCRNKSLLRVDSESTAKWAAQTVGEALGSEYTKSTTHGAQGSSEGVTEHRYKREAVLPSEFMRLPPATAMSFVGFHIIPSVGVFRAESYYRAGLLPENDTPSFIPRPPEHQKLQPWTPEERTTVERQRPTLTTSEREITPNRIETPRITRSMELREERT